MTNADKIRAMMDEELAQWLTFIETRILDMKPDMTRSEMFADWFDWLKREVSKSGRRDGRMFRKLIHRLRKRRFCKANRWFCPDCIYHEHLFDGVVYRGVRCHYPTE